MKAIVVIEYCPKSHWLLRAAYLPQEFLNIFESKLHSLSQKVCKLNGDFHINIDGKKIFDQKKFGGFPEIKELKQFVGDAVAPGKKFGAYGYKNTSLFLKKFL